MVLEAVKGAGQEQATLHPGAGAWAPLLIPVPRPSKARMRPVFWEEDLRQDRELAVE